MTHALIECQSKAVLCYESWVVPAGVDRIEDPEGSHQLTFHILPRNGGFTGFTSKSLQNEKECFSEPNLRFCVPAISHSKPSLRKTHTSSTWLKRRAFVFSGNIQCWKRILQDMSSFFCSRICQVQLGFLKFSSLQ